MRINLHRLEKLFVDNSPAILTAVGVIGTVSTAYLTGKATFKAADAIREHNVMLDINDQYMPPKQKAQLVWKFYVPAVVNGSLTIVCIVAANRIGTRRAAALAAAYTLSEKIFDEYKEKVVEKIGEKKEQTVRDEIAQDRVNKTPVSTKEVILTGNGEVLCFDGLTGRYFQSTVENIKKAQNDINYQILHQMYASLSDFYDKIGLATTPYSEEVGWNADHLLELSFSTVLSDDMRPCISLDYQLSPIRGFARLQ